MIQQPVRMDSTGWKILELLQKDARISFAELGRKIGLSTPAVAERVRKLEDAGVITGYHAALNITKLGLPIRVLIRLTIHGGDLQVKRAIAVIREMAEVARCYRVTGQESFVLEADVVSVRHLEELIDKLSSLGTTATSTVLSCPVERREYCRVEIEKLEKHL
ncbi:Lrp/AsnC family transcriptional regulator [Acidicapsa dinghuensis]|uniref:Lrp/AsnC family transcriptional regulator n=1 Tax=Acidicapsa dinghuensis TaxID=2218256 RepID=A0ABW1EDB6_9BACT|nr:Lrp/AsnC family transcriptional regulator [Acidicapsa dinghuensis]